MAKPIIFNNRVVIEPGVYAQLKGAVQKPIEGVSFGNLLWIDTGNLTPEWGFGAGVNGEINQNKIYQFTNVRDFKDAVGGGIPWDLMTYMFKPSADVRVSGIDSLFYIRAATTTAASASYTFTGGGSNGGTILFKSKVEGIAGNGVANGPGATPLLTRGFEAIMVAGTIDTSKFKFQFYRGAWRGQDTTVTPNEYIDGLAESAVSRKDLILETIEFDNLNDFVTWATNDSTFQTWFDFTSTIPGGSDGSVDNADLVANSTRKLFTGGTQTFGAQDLVDALSAVSELDYTFVMCDRNGQVDSTLVSIWEHIENTALYEKFLMIGGGANRDAFNDPSDTVNPSHSVQIAERFDSSKVYVAHSDFYGPTINGDRLRRYSSIYTAAMMAGRMLGLEPQVPVTWLDINVTRMEHDMSKQEREISIQNGVLHIRDVPQRGLVIGQDINTKQDNTQDIYVDGTSPHGSIMRISSALNKGIVQNIGNNFIAGQNVNTASPEDVKAYVQGYLISRTASATADNLIISFQNVTVTANGSDYKVSYAFTPNGPINRIFVTGFILPINISA